MKFIISGKNITVSQGLRTAVEDKLGKLERYFTPDTEVIAKDNICGGVIIMDEKNNVYPVRSPYVVLACGGLGGLYKNSTNFPHIAGDGLGIAMKHQVVLEHLDYVQIHPTTQKQMRS